MIQFMRNEKASIILSALVWNAMMPVLMAALKSTEESNVPIPRMDMWLLLKGIKSVVGEKESRFKTTGGKISGTKSMKLRARDIFLRITQPQEQIEKLVEATYQMFQAPDHTVEMEVSLAAVADGKMVGRSFIHYFPGNRTPSLSIDELNHPSTTASRAIADEKLHLVQDTTDELAKPIEDRKYMPFHELHSSNGYNAAQTGNTSDKSGGRKSKRGCKEQPRSVIAYPVRTAGHISYVLTIIAEKGGYFHKKRIDVYKYVLEEIGLRISLEHNLKALKSHVENTGGD